MSLNVSAEGGKDFEKIPDGLYVARCYSIIDLGTQTGSPAYGGKLQKKVNFVWEILDDPKMEDGRPFSVSKMYTASLFETANLRLDLEKWRNKTFEPAELENFDLKNVLGKYCQVQVAENEKGYTDVKSVVMPKFAKDADGKPIGVPTPVNKDVFFDIDNPDMQVFESLNNFIKGKIMAAPEWNKKEEPAKSTDKKDIVIEDIDDGEQVDLSTIPF